VSRRKRLSNIDPESLGEPLTQQQVDTLPAGAIVAVLWSGGNGPWKYRLRRHFSTPIAVSMNSHCDVGDLTGCGKYPLNQVWMWPNQETVSGEEWIEKNNPPAREEGE
jgi:hypothetical protein